MTVPDLEDEPVTHGEWGSLNDWETGDDLIAGFPLATPKKEQAKAATNAVDAPASKSRSSTKKRRKKKKRSTGDHTSLMWLGDMA